MLEYIFVVLANYLLNIYGLLLLIEVSGYQYLGTLGLWDFETLRLWDYQFRYFGNIYHDTNHVCPISSNLSTLKRKLPRHQLTDKFSNQTSWDCQIIIAKNGLSKLFEYYI